jgi:NADH dehydrogenase
VVIVGAGFGGLEVAKALNRAAVDVIVIDRQNHHCFQPLLYQVATAALSPAEIAWPIRHILRQQRNATVLMAEVSGIDLAGRCIQTSAGPISYDYLVIATGATHSYFGHDHWIDFAPGLKRIEDATRIRRSILLAFEHAELAHDDAERQRLLTFVIVGGGATGVEMAGAIAEIARQTLAKDFRRIDPRSSRIILLEAGPRVLPTLPEDLSAYAERTLTRMGVDVRTSTRVINCDRRGVDLDRGRMDASTIIWAAGVVASPAARWLGAEHDYAGRVLVRPDLSVPNHPEVFVIGDAAGRQANGPLCRAPHCGARRRHTIASAVSLSVVRRSRQHRAAGRGSELRISAPQGICRMAILESGPHLFPDRGQEPVHRGVHVAVGLPHVSSRRPAHHRGAAAGQRVRCSCGLNSR